MKNSKKLFLIFLSVLIVAFVSCKKDSGDSITTPTPTFKLSSLVGTWEEVTDNQAKDTFTVSDTGGISGTIDNQNANFNIDSWDKAKEVTQLTATHTNPSQSSGDTVFTFIFENANSCKASVKGSQSTTSKSFTKQATATIK